MTHVQVIDTIGWLCSLSHGVTPSRSRFTLPLVILGSETFPLRTDVDTRPRVLTGRRFLPVRDRFCVSYLTSRIAGRTASWE